MRYKNAVTKSNNVYDKRGVSNTLTKISSVKLKGYFLVFGSKNQKKDTCPGKLN